VRSVHSESISFVLSPNLCGEIEDGIICTSHLHSQDPWTPAALTASPTMSITAASMDEAVSRWLIARADCIRSAPASAQIYARYLRCIRIETFPRCL
jgi:hypothetical protein